MWAAPRSTQRASIWASSGNNRWSEKRTSIWTKRADCWTAATRCRNDGHNGGELGATGSTAELRRQSYPRIHVDVRRCEHRGRVLQAFNYAPVSFAASGWSLLSAIPERTG